MKIYKIMEVTKGLINSLVIMRICVGIKISPEFTSITTIPHTEVDLKVFILVLGKWQNSKIPQNGHTSGPCFLPNHRYSNTNTFMFKIFSFSDFELLFFFFFLELQKDNAEQGQS